MKSPCLNPDPTRGGFALPVAVLTLVVLGALTMGSFFIGRQEGMISAASASSAEAFNLAEHGATEVLATRWQGLSSLPLWGSDTISDTLANGYYTVEVTRTASRLLFLSSLGTVTKGGLLRSGATRRVGVIASLSPPDIDLPGALTTRGTTQVKGNSEVIGFDVEPDDWTCSGTLTDMPGIVSDSGHVTTSGQGEVTGNPATVADSTVVDSTFTQFGSLSWSELTQLATVTLPGGTINGTGPVLDGNGECDTSDPDNWGDPLNPDDPCGSYFPVIYVNGLARMQSGGVGQGVLLVEGNLDLRGGFTFHGIIIVQGDFETQGSGNRVMGGVLAGNASFDTQTLTGGSEVQYSSCAIEHSLIESTLTRIRPLESRSWVDLSSVIG